MCVDLDRAVVAAVGMLNVHPGARLSVGSKYRPVNSDPAVPLDAQRADAFAGVVQIAVLVQIHREPDVVVDAAVPVFDDVDVAVVVDGEVVRAVERRADGGAGGEIDGVAVGEHGDRLVLQVEPVDLVRVVVVVT